MILGVRMRRTALHKRKGMKWEKRSAKEGENGTEI